MSFTLHEIPRYHPAIKFRDSIIGFLDLPPVSQHQDRVLCYLYLISAITTSRDSAGSYLHHLSLEAVPSIRPAMRMGPFQGQGPGQLPEKPVTRRKEPLGLKPTVGWVAVRGSRLEGVFLLL